jgi:hypothetical protein
MRTRKIADLPVEKRCRDPEHDPPKYFVFQPGVYEHECPTCKHVHTFVVRPPGRIIGGLAGGG